MGGLHADQDEDDDDIEGLIRSQQEKQNVKSGAQTVKRAVKGQAKQGASAVGGGSFQSMGLHPSLLRALIVRGYKTPTPIQRASIPSLLASPPRDLVGMARTGSGKTLAYMIPLLQRLGGRHSTSFGARALVLVPARELALQVLKVGKELARGWNSGAGAHAGDNEVDEEQESKSSQALRWGLIVGGESMDEQFEVITSNPDVIIATPGRLLHLAVEMNLDLKSIQYVVFDEADRLFEMGFETALTEILHRLPATRQTLLFSATLPKSLVEFAKAGLQNPKLIRLDAESKISSDLRMGFFSVKAAEKEACLLSLLRDVIQVPLGGPSRDADESGDEDSGDEDTKKKRKGKGKAKERIAKPRILAPHQTLIFVATKHHVEYLIALLAEVGYAVSHIYGALDQAARTLQMDKFRRGVTSILVVTDVAARGIDIPVLENVINYDFPHGARVFVHRVGRTARAGQKGWAWSFVTHNELPHLLDLQLFLGRPLASSAPDGEVSFTESLVLGTFDRDTIDTDVEYLARLDVSNSSLPTLKQVMTRGQTLYERSIGKASQASFARAKEMVKDGRWGLSGAAEAAHIHPIFALRGEPQLSSSAADALGEGTSSSTTAPATTSIALNPSVIAARNSLMKAVESFRPNETVFEIGARGKTAGAVLMNSRRKTLEKIVRKTVTSETPTILADDSNWDAGLKADDVDMEMADEAELESVFELPTKKKQKRDFRDKEFFMSHYQKDAATDKGYSLKDGASFTEQARNATFDLAGDESGLTGRQRHDKQLAWDKKKKKFVKAAQEGADNVKLVKTESGARLPASFRSGRFDEWKAKNKTSLPRVGEAESERAARAGGNRTFGSAAGGKKYRFNSTQDAKPLDPRNIGYDRKVRILKKKQAGAAGDGGDDGERPAGKSGGGKGGRPGKGSKFSGANVQRAKNELKSAEQIRRSRAFEAQKKARNARPSKKGKR
ncbi:DEAD-domain-containing protein [Clavulina sp. PMI_390]|nr:DEAD-domain-containing protein [Clavulina sp. PMI_390]